MATLALTAIGTIIGGPIGGALGAIAGRSVDQRLFGSGSREGPRLEELTVSTSSYGTPIPQYFGMMRSAGSIIWATDLMESTETNGGKGQPDTTSYSYSTSFAVALSSRKIRRVGRIWANGNLLRGADGTLKTQGSLRTYLGHGDQDVDPLIATVEGGLAPAFRGTAYVVFEDLQLADFGNRIPALTFEVVADDGDLSLGAVVNAVAPNEPSETIPLAGLTGLVNGGGSFLNTLDVLKSAFPFSVTAGPNGSLFLPQPDFVDPSIPLGPSLDSNLAREVRNPTGKTVSRQSANENQPIAIRYYDVQRDYQIGLQRPVGRASTGSNETLEIPGALNADNARMLATTISRRVATSGTKLRWTVAELDDRVAPGKIVTVPGFDGKWAIASWEWNETGIELELESLRPELSNSAMGAPGKASLPADVLPPKTKLRAFELPWDGIGTSDEIRVFAAASSTNANWLGATLYRATAGQLNPAGSARRTQAVTGTVQSTLESGQALIFDREASLEIAVDAAHMLFEPASIEEIANGSNRLLVGPEIIQYCSAVQSGSHTWVLSGLLRGRGGTESSAKIAHQLGTPVTLINKDLTQLPEPTTSAAPSDKLAAIGRGDTEPVLASVENAGTSRRPIHPVHGRIAFHTDGSMSASWTRRGRGAWHWLDGVGTPLSEEAEKYLVGVGSVIRPRQSWITLTPHIEISVATLTQFSGEPVWVQQIGRHALSQPLLLAQLPQK